MGDISDMMIDQMIDEMLGRDEQYIPDEPCYDVWETRDGQELPVKDMTSLHLKNTIKMLERGHYIYKDGYIDRMNKELKNRNKEDKIMKIQNVELNVVGVTFKNDNGSSRAAIIMDMADNEDSSVNVRLERERDNKYDINAIKVIAEGGQIGYIGKDYASIMAPMMDMGTQFNATIVGCGEFKNRPYCKIRVDEL